MIGMAMMTIETPLHTAPPLDQLARQFAHGIVKLTHREALIGYRGRGTAPHSPLTPPFPCR